MADWINPGENADGGYLLDTNGALVLAAKAPLGVQVLHHDAGTGLACELRLGFEAARELGTMLTTLAAPQTADDPGAGEGPGSSAPSNQEINHD